MTQEEIDARIKELEAERDKKLAETPFERYGPGKTSHGKIRRYYNFKIGNLRKHGVENPLQRPELKKRMIDTRIERYGCGHGNVQKMLETKVEKWGNKSGNVAKVTETKRKLYGNGVGDIEAMKEKKIARYGNAWGPQDKIKATKLERWGNTWGNIEACKQTRIKRWGTAAGNVEAQRATKRAKYGNINNALKAAKTKFERYGGLFVDAEATYKKIHDTKLAKYGNIFGDRAKIKQTMLERYGVPYYCMTAHCRLAQGKVISKHNVWWHDKLLEHFGIDFEYEFPVANAMSFDLGCAELNLVIDINPTFSHNSAYSYDYATGRSDTNWHRPVNNHANRCCAAIAEGFRVIVIWDWDDVNDIIALLDAIIHNTEQLKTDDIIDIDLCKDDVTQYVNDYKLLEYKVVKHWHCIKTGEHVTTDANFNCQPLIDCDYVPVYDCGHAILQRKLPSNI